MLFLEHATIGKTTLYAESGKPPFPVPCTYRTMLKNYLEIQYIPSRHLIELLSELFKGEKTKQLMTRLLDDRDFFQSFVKDSNMIPAELIEKLQTLEAESGNEGTVEIPVEMMIEGLPFRQCRYYSISSSPKVRGGFVGFAFGSNWQCKAPPRRDPHHGSRHVLAVSEWTRRQRRLHRLLAATIFAAGQRVYQRKGRLPHPPLALSTPKAALSHYHDWARNRFCAIPRIRSRAHVAARAR
jgi:hypothetical protein